MNNELNSQQPTTTPAPSATPVVAPEPAPAPQTAEPTPAPTGTPQQQSREAIYARFYGTDQPPAQPAPEPVPEPTTTEPASTQPPASSVAPAAGLPPEQIKQLVSDVIKTLMPTNAPAPATTPAAPAAPAAPPPDPSGWVKKLTGGDWEGATKDLEQQILQSVQAQLAPQIQQQTLQEAIENFKAETELNTFVNDIRQKNSDIVALEPLLAPKIQLAMQAWLQSQGGPVAPLAYVEEYKKVATQEINDARNLIQQLRAAGAERQQVVHQEVLSSTTLPPTSAQTPQTPPAPPAPQTAQDYLAMRQAQALRRNGMILKT